MALCEVNWIYFLQTLNYAGNMYVETPAPRGIANQISTMCKAIDDSVS